MSQDGKRPPGDDTSKPIRLVQPGETGTSQISEEQVRQIYMASPHLEWASFAKSLGWEPEKTRKAYQSYAKWIQEKKDILARQQAESIAELIFDHRSRWHSDILHTLREYPSVTDTMLNIVKTRLNEVIEAISEDQQEGKLSGKRVTQRFSAYKTGELKVLAESIRVLTECKHRSLLISDWSVKVAEQFTDPKQFESVDEKMKDHDWKINVIGGKTVSNEELEKRLMRYYDQRPLPEAGSLEELADADSQSD